MQAGARCLEGRHDFRALASRAEADEDCVRTLYAVRVSTQGGASTLIP